MQQIVSDCDYLVCLAGETTVSSAPAANYRRTFVKSDGGDLLKELSGGEFNEAQISGGQAFGDCSQEALKKTLAGPDGASLPRTLHLEWCICQVKDFKILEVGSDFIKTGQALDEKTTSQTGVGQPHVDTNGVSFEDAFNKLKNQISTTCGSKKTKFVVAEDWFLRYQVPLDAARHNYVLDACFKEHVNLLKIHYDSKKASKNVKDLAGLLSVYDFQPIDQQQRAKTDCTSISRLLNRMVKNVTEKLEVEVGQAAADSTAESNTAQRNSQSENARRRSRSRDNSPGKHDTAMKSDTTPTASNNNFQPDDPVALRLRGLPFSAQDQDIIAFFSNHKLLTDSIKIGQNEDGRATGQAVVLFESASDAETAMNELQGQNVGHRWIELIQIAYKDYSNFTNGGGRGGSSRPRDGGGMGGGNGGGQTITLRSYINESNQQRAVKMRGLPWRVTEQEILEFFEGYPIQSSDIVIEETDGRRTGFGLVFMPTEDDAEKAIGELDRKEIGTRWIGLSTPQLPRGNSQY